MELQQADVRKLGSRPLTWTTYDLILSTSMLEHLSKTELPADSYLASRSQPRMQRLERVGDRPTEWHVRY